MPATRLGLGHRGGRRHPLATGLQLGNGGGGKQLCIAGGKAFCCGGKMKFVWRKVIPWIVDLRAINALVSKFRWVEDRVQHMEWKDRQGEQGPNKNVLQFPVC
jgi:hypothetical protein